MPQRDGVEGTVDHLNAAPQEPITWHFVGGRCQAVSCLQIALQETTGWADWFALQQAQKMFDKIQYLRDGQPG